MQQRVKLTKELGSEGNIYVLDEPNTGLHASDIKNIMHLLETIVQRGNTVLVIEHNTDVMKMADYIIDIGPDGGNRGGNVIACGKPEDIVKVPESYTGEYIKKEFDKAVK